MQAHNSDIHYQNNSHALALFLNRAVMNFFHCNAVGTNFIYIHNPLLKLTEVDCYDESSSSNYELQTALFFRSSVALVISVVLCFIFNIENVTADSGKISVLPMLNKKLALKYHSRWNETILEGCHSEKYP